MEITKLCKLIKLWSHRLQLQMGPHHCPAILQMFSSCSLFHNSYLSSRFLLYPTALPNSQEKEYLLTSSWKPPLLSTFSPSNTFFLATYPLIPKELPLKRRVSLRLLWFPSHPIFPQGPPSLLAPLSSIFNLSLFSITICTYLTLSHYISSLSTTLSSVSTSFHFGTFWWSSG